MERTSKIKSESNFPFKRPKQSLSPKKNAVCEPQLTEQLQVGLVTFKSGTTLKNLQTILNNKKQTFFKQKCWAFKSLKLSSDKETKFYSKIDQLGISQLEYNDTKMPKILESFQHIKFSNLTKLSLPSNSITNIEALGSLNAENLKCLDLGRNLICQSKQLRKLKLQKLQFLEVSNNPLYELNLGRIQQQNNKVYPRIISFPSEIVFQEVGFLAKLEHNVVSSIMEFDLKYYNGESRYGFSFNGNKDQRKLILQKKVCKALKKKLVFE